MRAKLSFFVTGIPKGQPRAKACVRGKHAGVYDPGTADEWKLFIRHEAKKAWDGVPWDGAIKLSPTVYFPRPKKHFKTGKKYDGLNVLRDDAPVWHTSKPDRDNVDKALMDALTSLGVLADDAKVCDGRIRKLYATGSQPTGALIEISEALE